MTTGAETGQTFAVLQELPERLAAVIITALKTDMGVHAETAIATAATLTGEYVLRASGFDFSGMAPGSAVFSETANQILFDADGQLTVSDVFINALFAGGVDVSKNSWPETVPEAHQVVMDPLQILGRMRPELEALFGALELDYLERAYAAAGATAALVSQTRKVLDPNIGKALALEAMLRGVKTVPKP